MYSSQSVKSILLKEGLQDLLSSVLYDHSRLLQLLLFGHPSLKLKPTTYIYNASLNTLNALTALPPHNTLNFSVIVTPLSFYN